MNRFFLSLYSTRQATVAFTAIYPSLLLHSPPTVSHVKTEAPPSGVSLISSALSRDDVQKRNGMMARLTQQLAAMRTYESEGLQGKARRIIPVKELGEKARNREDAASSSFADRLLLELLHWFKHSFFSWVSLTEEKRDGEKGLLL